MPGKPVMTLNFVPSTELITAGNIDVSPPAPVLPSGTTALRASSIDLIGASAQTTSTPGASTMLPIHWNLSASYLTGPGVNSCVIAIGFNGTSNAVPSRGATLAT